MPHDVCDVGHQQHIHDIGGWTIPVHDPQQVDHWKGLDESGQLTPKDYQWDQNGEDQQDNIENSQVGVIIFGKADCHILQLIHQLI